MYILIEDIKKHLNIDYEEDDTYIAELIEAAEDAVQKFIQQPLEGLVDEDGKIPVSLRHAIRLMVGGFYATPGISSVCCGSCDSLQHSFSY